MPCVTNERTKDIKNLKREINYIRLNKVENMSTLVINDNANEANVDFTLSY